LVLEFEGEKADELNKFFKLDKYGKNYTDAKKNISRWANSLKISQRIQDLAIIRFGQIYRIVENDPKTVTQHMMTVYALYAAAFEEEEWMIEDSLIKRSKTNPE